MDLMFQAVVIVKAKVLFVVQRNDNLVASTLHCLFEIHHRLSCSNLVFPEIKIEPPVSAIDNVVEVKSAFSIHVFHDIG